MLLPTTTTTTPDNEIFFPDIDIDIDICKSGAYWRGTSRKYLAVVEKSIDGCSCAVWLYVCVLVRSMHNTTTTTCQKKVYAKPSIPIAMLPLFDDDHPNNHPLRVFFFLVPLFNTYMCLIWFLCFFFLEFHRRPFPPTTPAFSSSSSSSTTYYYY